MLKAIFTATVFALAALAGVPGLADPLPADARPLGPNSITRIYAGSTANWSSSRAHFAADGTVQGIHKGDSGTSLFWGNWAVSGNEICMTNQYRNLDTGEAGTLQPDCWQWFIDGNRKTWTLWSKHFDGSAPDLANGFYDGELGKLRRGDTVRADFARLNG